MGCRYCEEAQDAEQPLSYYYRWDTANIEVRGCPDHIRQVFQSLNYMQQDKKRMRPSLNAKYEEAMIAKYLYGGGKITREEAEERVEPYLTEANEIAKEIARKYGNKAHPITFIKFMR